MALGDLSTFSMLNRAIWVARVTGELGADTTPDDIVSVSLFAVSAELAPLIRSKRRGRVSRLLSLGKAAQQSVHPIALTAVMTVLHDVQIFGTASGVEAIEVPFPHIVFFVGAGSAEFRWAAEGRIAELLRNDWNDLIDPLIELRVRMFLGQDTNARGIVGYFGRGIFAPRHNQRPIGRVEIGKVGSSSVEQPTLPEGIPAGLYRGQAALAFSSTENLTPAVSAIVPEHFRFLLRGGGPFEQSSPALFLECDVTGPNAEAYRPLITRIEPLPAGYDAAFMVETDDGGALEVKVIEDMRPSRLLSSPPPGRFYFAIVGIVAPEERDDLSIQRWWIDLDYERKLVSSALRSRAISIVCEDDKVEAYDWTASGRKVVAQAHLVEAKTPDGVFAVLEVGSGDLGYLQPPARNVTMGFSDEWASFASRHTDETRYDFDWLDFSGAVETPSRYAERLAVCAAKQNVAPVWLPGLEGRAMHGAGLHVRRPGGRIFEHEWDGSWEGGKELIAGPFLLRIVDRQEGDREELP